VYISPFSKNSTVIDFKGVPVAGVFSTYKGTILVEDIYNGAPNLYVKIDRTAPDIKEMALFLTPEEADDIALALTFFAKRARERKEGVSGGTSGT
jgi:hypothetical protein